MWASLDEWQNVHQNNARLMPVPDSSMPEPEDSGMGIARFARARKI